MRLSRLWLVFELKGTVRAGRVTVTMQSSIDACPEPLTNKTLNLILI